ncbi:MAG: hypothetical protein ACLRPT_06460 [Akkermansia muciniphila]
MPNFIASLKTFYAYGKLPKYPPVQKPPPAFETAQDKSENRRTLSLKAGTSAGMSVSTARKQSVPCRRETHALFSGHIGLKIRFIHHERVQDSPANYSNKKSNEQP